MKDEPRIGVFVCHCGTNIGGYVDVPGVVEYTKSLAGVVHAENNIYTCADDGLTAIKNAIRNHDLNRVIVASCTPRTHAPLFRSAVASAGLNPYLFELVNIREQCSWVHMKQKEAATQKAKDLIRMGVARTALLEPQEEIRINVTPTALVMGGGIAGMTAALSIANQGFKVDIVEKDNEMGGMLRHLNDLYPGGRKASLVISDFIEKVKRNPNIETHTSSVVNKVEGYIGNFAVSIRNENGPQEIRTGVIIVATGADELKPVDHYGYGSSGNVLTGLELEERLRNGSLQNLKSAVFIQCVGSRGEGRSYCSRICCNVAVKNSIILKNMFPEADINILHNGIHVYGTYEQMYRQAQELGVGFRKYSKEKLPEVTVDSGLRVKLYHELMGKEMEYTPDVIVLSTPLIPHPENGELSRMLKVPLGQEGFFLEAHVKLRPVDFATDGIFICGSARAPADVAESINQGYAAASRAAIPLDNGYVQAEAITAVVDEAKCIGCGLCASVCPYRAASMKEKKVVVEEVPYITKKSDINPALCKGCGTCAACCPAGAITPKHFTLPQIIATIRAFQPGAGYFIATV
jgi:heterodisulfide reductase subunit A